MFKTTLLKYPFKKGTAMLVRLYKFANSYNWLGLLLMYYT